MIVGTRLFLVSYAILWQALVFRSVGRVEFVVLFEALAVWGLVDAFRLVNAGRRRSSRRVTFDAVRDKGGDVGGYLASYILPLLMGPPSTWPEAGTLAMYFVAAWAVFVPSDLGLVNPTLYLLGWRVGEVVWGDNRALLVYNRLPKAGTDQAVSSLMGGAGYVLRPDAGQ